MILPDMLKNAPMLKNISTRGGGRGGVRGKSAILGAQAGAGGRGRGRGFGGGDRGDNLQFKHFLKNYTQIQM